jgi:hypothetical protein
MTLPEERFKQQERMAVLSSGNMRGKFLFCPPIFLVYSIFVLITELHSAVKHLQDAEINYQNLMAVTAVARDQLRHCFAKVNNCLLSIYKYPHTMGPRNAEPELTVLEFLDAFANSSLLSLQDEDSASTSDSFEELTLRAALAIERSSVAVASSSEAGPSTLSHPVPSPPRGPPTKKSRSQYQRAPSPLPESPIVVEDEEPTAPVTRSKKGKPRAKARTSGKKW